MLDVILLFIGALLGGIISWIITHNYYNKNIDDNAIFRDVSVHGVIEQNIDLCWSAITNPENKKYFTVTHSYGYSDSDKEIGVGTIQKSGGFMGSKFEEIICAWEPPVKFAFGRDKDNWHHFIELKKSGDKTNIFLKRRFWIRTKTWQEVILDKIFKNNNSMSDYELANDTLRRLIAICEGRPT
ncbi:hypothetical protein [Flavivirga algicola]|uniref:Polyketide cyclase n=1 Tax=Flavivirga algicola TaxID=2729136 RepID=A0ABX1S4P1_9FLAO|nr:hypothetical protein [Flavivirga algicola]NMH89838.1 hypothetical protein [Flavivirga algicola]